ncbi:hypothetical protein CLOP_g4416 [Closterium sp. NIES-67]|nr:hypothetical protein CLOP_g4416 [Closterium sp. NIES-67]
MGREPVGDSEPQAADHHHQGARPLLQRPVPQRQQGGRLPAGAAAGSDQVQVRIRGERAQETRRHLLSQDPRHHQLRVDARAAPVVRGERALRPGVLQHGNPIRPAWSPRPTSSSATTCPTTRAPSGFPPATSASPPSSGCRSSRARSWWACLRVANRKEGYEETLLMEIQPMTKTVAQIVAPLQEPAQGAARSRSGCAPCSRARGMRSWAWMTWAGSAR